jgi:hypothetical protein
VIRLHAGGNEEWDGAVRLQTGPDGVIRLKVRASGVLPVVIRPTDSPIKVRHLYTAVRLLSFHQQHAIRLVWCSPPRKQRMGYTPQPRLGSTRPTHS